VGAKRSRAYTFPRETVNYSWHGARPEAAHGLGRIAPQSESEKAACAEAGLDTGKILRCEDLVRGDSMYFSATGITDSVILDGVHYHGSIVTTHSLVLRYETQTRREIKTEHRLK